MITDVGPQILLGRVFEEFFHLMFQTFQTFFDHLSKKKEKQG